MNTNKGVTEMDEMSLIAAFIGSVGGLRAKEATAEETVDFLRSQGLETEQVEPTRTYRADAEVVSYHAQGTLRDRRRHAVVVYPENPEQYLGTNEDSATIRLEQRLVPSNVAVNVTIDHIESPGGNRLAFYAVLQGERQSVPYQVMWKLPRGLLADSVNPCAQGLSRPPSDRMVHGTSVGGRY